MHILSWEKAQLSNYFDHFKLLINSQFGFRRSLSNSHKTFDTLQYLYDNLDEGNTAIFFLDSNKAFDCANHGILLDKMSVYVCIASSWFKSYLSDRQQYVSLTH